MKTATEKRNFLKARIIERGFLENQVAAKIGMSPSTFCRKMKDPETFSIKEMGRIISTLKLDDADILKIVTR